MTLLLDTNIVVAVVQREEHRLSAAIQAALASDQPKCVSTASLWEMAIKVRLGKLPLSVPLEEIPQGLAVLTVALLSVNEHHALAELRELPATRDPFDRLLLAQCQVEDMRLITRDRALESHPLAWRP